MLKYLKGFLKYLFNFRISKLSLIDNSSVIQKKSRIFRFVKILNSKVDSYSYIGSGSVIVSSKIGKFCSISNNVHIGLGLHEVNIISTSPIFFSCKNSLNYKWVKEKKNVEYKEVIIGNDVWIGYNVIILGGKRVGNGSVIAAGSIVTKDIPPYAIVAGVPAKIIRYRFTKEIIEKLLILEWWNFSETILKENAESFSNQDISSIINILDRYTNY